MYFAPCGNLMIRADYYDPEGIVPLYGMVERDGRLWACISHGKREDGCRAARAATTRACQPAEVLSSSDGAA